MIISRRLRPAALALAGLAAATWPAVPVAGTQSPPSQQAVPTPADADLVRLDVVVLGVDGAAVPGLTRDDFDVLERGGSSRPIAAFGEVRREPPATAAASLPPDLPSDVATNRQAFADRVIVLFVDDRAGSGEAGDPTLAREVIDRAPPDAVIGLMFASGRPAIELTTDRERLRRAVDRDPVRVLDAGNTFEALAAAIRPIQTGERRRRALLWLAADVSVDVTAGPVAGFLDAARQAGVSVYGMAPDTSSTANRGGVASLAAATGGAVFSGGVDRVLDRIIDEIDHHYLLAVRAADIRDERDLRVRVRREGLAVRQRRGPRAHDADEPGVSPASSAGLAPSAAVPMTLAASAFPGGRRDVPVAVAFAMEVPREALEAADPLLRDEVDYTVEAVHLDTGRVTARRGRNDVVALKPRRLGADAAVVYEIASWIDLRPGPYQLRLTARSTGLDLTGSVYLTIDVPDASGQPIAVSGLVLGYRARPPAPVGAAGPDGLLMTPELRQAFGGGLGGAVVHQTADAGGRGLPVDPALTRRFDSWDELQLYFEVERRGSSRDALATVIVIDDQTGRIVHTSRPAVGRRSRETFVVDLPLTEFPPSAYRIQVEVDDGGSRAVGEAAFVMNGVPAAPGADPAAPPVTPAAPVLPPAPPDASAGGRPAEAIRLRPDGPSGAEALRTDTGADQLASEGWDLYGKGDVRGAQVKLAAAVASGSQSPWIHYVRGLAEFALGRFDVAAASWEFVRARQPDYQPAYFDLADAYLSLNRTREAQSVLEEAVRRWSDDPEAHNALGVVLFGRRLLDDAIATFQRATKAAPGEGLGYFNLGRAYQARMVRWQTSRTVQTAVASQALADRDRQQAIAAYRRALDLGGSFDWDAREAIRILSGGYLGLLSDGALGPTISLATVSSRHFASFARLQ
jgi:VWFA-related protein